MVTYWSLYEWYITEYTTPIKKWNMFINFAKIVFIAVTPDVDFAVYYTYVNVDLEDIDA